MEVKGKLITCDRCGRQVFLKTIGDGEADGGYTRWNKFEDAPEGWKHQFSCGQLCPECNEEYESVVSDFMNKNV